LTKVHANQRKSTRMDGPPLAGVFFRSYAGRAYRAQRRRRLAARPLLTVSLQVRVLPGPPMRSMLIASAAQARKAPPRLSPQIRAGSGSGAMPGRDDEPLFGRFLPFDLALGIRSRRYFSLVHVR
jgi:hypothetical protein